MLHFPLYRLSVLLLGDIAATADVFVAVRVEGLAMLGEVPFHGAVRQLAVAHPEAERLHGDCRRPALGHRLVGPDPCAGARPDGLAAAPGFPADVGDQAGRAAAVEDPGGLDLSEPG